MAKDKTVTSAINAVNRFLENPVEAEKEINRGDAAGLVWLAVVKALTTQSSEKESGNAE